MHGCGSPGKQGHAGFTAGYQQVIDCCGIHDDPGGAVERSVILYGNARGRFRFLAVGSQNGCSLIAGIIPALWIDKHRNPSGACRADDRSYYPGGKHPLEIIRKQHRVKSHDVVAGPSADIVLHFAGYLFPRFPVNPHDLLVGGNDPRFSAGSTSRVSEDGIGGQISAVEFSEQGTAVFIISHNRTDFDMSTKSGQIIHNIARPANTKLLTNNIHHLNRCFRRDTLGFSPQVLVKHQIADHQAIDSANILKKGFDDLSIHDWLQFCPEFRPPGAGA